jgi:hypothetical protein
MHSSRQLVQLAQQHALAGFGSLIDRTLADAEVSMGQAARIVAADAQADLSAVRGLVRFEGRALRERIERHFAILIERAMQTMHTDLREGLRAIRADELSLQDEAVMDRQIEVERMVQRLRDADEASHGRLNLIIAQLHGVSQVRERENPFRPYLPARALYEAVGEMVKGEARAAILCEHLSAALAPHMHSYYGAILEVFEERGVMGRLVARPSALTRAERERLGWQRAAEGMRRPAADVADGRADSRADVADDPEQARRRRLLPKLQQLMNGAAATSDGFPDLDAYQDAEALRGLVRAIGAHGAAMRAPAAASTVPGAHLLDAHLLEALRAAQQAGLAGTGESEPLILARRLGAHDAGRVGRQHLDLLALLFEFMLEDRLLDARLRKEIGRLFVPFARCALAQPGMLQDAGHPAWRLLNRIGAVAAAIDADTPARAALEDAIRSAVDGVLRRCDGDSATFGAVESEFDAAVVAALHAADARGAVIAAAIGAAETLQLGRSGASAQLERLLAPLQIDPRIAAFLRTHWLDVLAHRAPDEAGHGQLLAELVWSAQHKPDAAQHGALMRLLPGLVRRLREGLSRRGLTEAASKAALDELVPVHMDVLANRQGMGAGMLALDALQRHFAAIERRAAAPGAGIAWLDHDALAAALARHGVTAAIRATPVDAVDGADEAVLAATFRPGMGLEFLDDGVYLAGQLVVAGAAGGAWACRIPGQRELAVYPRAALLAALRSGAVRALEYAPLYTRAVDALTVSADAMAA